MKRAHLLTFGAVFLGLLGQAVGQQRSGSHDVSKSVDAIPPASASVLRLARSSDGLAFADTGRVFLQHAAAPDLAVCANGDLIALFDYAGGGDSDRATLMAVSRSRDGGRSWSPARRVRLRGAKGRATRARHGDLVEMPDGRLRLYFTSTIERSRPGRRSRSNGATVIRSAETRDGLDYRLDPRTRISLPGVADAHPALAWIDRRLHLYAAGSGRRAGGRGGGLAIARHFTSGDGQRFAKLKAAQAPGAAFVGSVVSTDGGVRAYVTSDDGVTSFASNDGGRWEAEPGIRLPSGRDPAVVRLEDGSYLMLYCAAPDAKALTSNALVAAAFDDGKTGSAVDGGDQSARARAGDTDAEALADAGLDGGAIEADAGTDGGLQDYWDPIASDGFAPKLDFKYKVDYFEWYREYALEHPKDNAYHAYIRILPHPYDDAAWEEFRDTFNDMFNGDSKRHPPGPWDPAEHPEWEASNQQVQGWLDLFREASLHEGYASPPLLGDEEDSGILDGEELLLGLRLPSLSAHRTLAKATLADAWRIGEDGKVSSERMLEAWGTTLRAARHLERGATIIEDLVSIAEQALVAENARWALKHDVFSADKLETAFDTLREYDRFDRGFERSLRGEHAFSMDIAQYLFTPLSADGQPQINMRKMRAAFDFSDNLMDQFAQMGPGDTYATVEAFDAHCRELDELMGIGYPEVRTADIDAVAQKYQHTSPMTEHLMPALGRYYQLKTRSAASCRATQLAYATHLHKARTGDWPDSLDDLPAEYGTEMRIDPFTGDYFGYRVTDDGPTIYTASENGRDDGGIHSPRWADEIENDAGSDDHVFWPPQPRR